MPIFLRILAILILLRIFYRIWQRTRHAAHKEARRDGWAARQGTRVDLPVKEATTRASKDASRPAVSEKPDMALYQFWALIEDVHAETGFDMETKEARFKARLGELSVEDLRAFRLHFDAAMNRAYDWGLWAAAYVIHGGCSDDSFSDFRSTIIMLGKGAFEAALKDPDSLLEAARASGGDLSHENFAYPISAVWEEKSGKEAIEGRPLQPAEPTGQDWQEEDLPKIVPVLWTAYGN